MKRYLFLGFTIWTCFTGVYLGSQSAFQTSLGTRITGMGGAGLVSGETSEAIYYNWAAPSPFTKLMLKLDQGKAIEFPIYSMSAQNPFNISKLRLSYSYMTISEFQRTALNDRDHPYQLNDTFSNTTHMLYSSYYWQLSSINIGIRNHLYYETLDTESGYSYGLDFALYSKFNTKHIPIEWGLTLTNYLSSPEIWSTGHKDILPKLITSGFGASITPQWKVVADWTLENNRLNPLKIGTEYWLSGNWNSMPSYAVRGGVMGNDTTLGIGVHSSLFFDYAIVIPKETYRSIEHRFSITKTFDTFEQTHEPEAEMKKLSFSLTDMFKTTSIEEPQLIFSLQSSIDFQEDTLYFWCDSLPENPECNGNPIVPNISQTQTFPIVIFSKTPNAPPSFLVSILELKTPSSSAAHSPKPAS